MIDGKKLLSARFASTSGLYEVNLGANAPDSIYPQDYTVHESKTRSMNQVGAFIQAWDSNASGLNSVHQVALYDCMKIANGYGTRVGLLPSLSAVNVPLYLNGVPNLNGVDMPYLKWVMGSYTYVLHYFRSDGTDLGYLFNYVPSDRYPSVWAGQLYVDGTFTGDTCAIDTVTILGNVYSRKYYKWWWTYHWENLQVISPSVITDLQEYLPHDPEGEFTDNGNGDFDSTSDPIGFPDVPTLNVLDTGMTQIYEMTSTQLRSLSQYLWSSNFSLDNFKKMFNDPMEAILNLTITPVDLTSTATTSNIRIGNITTSVSGQRLSEQYKMVDFGTINMNEYWANFGDYSPYTKLSIYLPYVGVQQISIDDVQNGSIQLKCVIDVLTGSIQYMLYSIQGNRRGHGHKSILYTWGGNCQYQVPLSASNMTNVITSLIGATGTIAGAVGATIATGGMTAPLAIGAVGGVVSNVTNAKTHVQRGGGLGGAVGLFGVQYPYLILERPEQIAPENYPDTLGIPNETTNYIKNFAGFVKVRAVNLNIPNATTDELNTIESLLKDGVIV